MGYKSTAITIKGRKENNEDAFLADDSRGIYIVCDGFSGDEPDTASIAVKLLESSLSQVNLEKVLWELPSIHKAIQTANDELYKVSQKRNKPHNMGTTMDCLLMLNDFSYIAHIGDSRIYNVDSAHKLNQLTKDQSEVQRRIDKNIISLKEAKFDPQYFQVTNKFGKKGAIHYQHIVHPLADTNRLFMTTDGLTDVMLDETLTEIVTSKSDDLAILSDLEMKYRSVAEESIAAFLNYSPEPLQWALHQWDGLPHESMKDMQNLRERLETNTNWNKRYDLLSKALKDPTIRQLFEGSGTLILIRER